MKEVTRKELADILANVKGCKFASVDAFCEISTGDYVGGKSGNAMCGKGYKMHEGVMMLLGASYERMVSKRTEAAGKGEFKASVIWHEKVAGGLYRHKEKGSQYLAGPYAQRAVEMMDTDEAEALAELRTVDAYEQLGGKVSYFVKEADGTFTPTTFEALGLRSSGRGGAQGGLDEASKVIFRMFKLENVTAVRLNGEEYRTKE